jgi:tRNA-splicing ligase RtcB
MNINLMPIKKIGKAIWEINQSYKTGMLVPARIVATKKLLQEMDDGVAEQLANVACLPGVVDAVWAMPDAHWGYGAPIGGVFATDPEKGGIVSPGATGFDINCGVRLLVTPLLEKQAKEKTPELIDRLFPLVGAGVGGQGILRLKPQQLATVIQKGSQWVISQGWGEKEDLKFTEENGCLEGADIAAVSQRAIERALKQLGSLGSGNHYLEIQRVEKIIDRRLAERLGIQNKGQITIMIHCGSRGFGHQIATDYLIEFNKAANKYKTRLYDRQLACAPIDSPEAKKYLAAMAAAANFAFANRQILTHQVRRAFWEVFRTSPKSLPIKLVYDVAHNVAKWENGLLVHRKGATRSLGPGNPILPNELKPIGQPVIIGGSMETASWLLLGTKKAEKLTFSSTCHGSGRAMSRRAAKKMARGDAVQKRMREKGIYVHGASFAGLAEEAGNAYKDVDAVVEAAAIAGISVPIAKFTPLGNIKG